VDQQGAGAGQGKVEAHNFDIRKNLLKYDNVMNDQRKVVFEQAHRAHDGGPGRRHVRDMRHEVIEELVAKFIPSAPMPSSGTSTDSMRR
jgi:preprotein translocase subunit SecA